MPDTVYNTLLLLAEAVVYFAVMIALFRARDRFGIGIFVATLGVMHFLETYLAAVFYIALPFGIISPGSTVLFSGKLCMLLLLYIKEDAAAVRQPIYGLLIGNFLMVALILIARNHITVPPVPGRTADLGFVDEIGWLMILGTLLLYVDAIMIILMWERLSRAIKGHFVLRLALCTAAVLTFDQLGFYVALRMVTGAPVEVLIGGWVAKMGSALVFSVLTGIYLRSFEVEPRARLPRPLWDVFDLLTYRQRYEALLETAGQDGLTGLLDRRRFDGEVSSYVYRALGDGRAISLFMIDVDHFKRINDSYGHAVGDETLRAVARQFRSVSREEDRLYRYGGEEFVLICVGLDHVQALATAERLRQAAARVPVPDGHPGLTVSIGVATAPQDGEDVGDLFHVADARLYDAKRAGRDRWVGQADEGTRGPEGSPAPA